MDDGVIEVKAYADTLMKAHLNHADPHPQYAPKASPVFTGTPIAPTAKTFPLNTPVLLTDVLDASGKAGNKGTLARALDAIAAQAKPVTVVVCVPQGKTEAETTTHIIGGVTAEGKKTGIKALLAAQGQLGVKPRILGVLGHDTQAVAAELLAAAQRLRAKIDEQTGAGIKPCPMSALMASPASARMCSGICRTQALTC
ncbi:putative phage major tail sheath protein [Sodalis glossinidius str. 'morsitans']|uniref:Phage major tail sheath protein n=1 Tax=Sodalis glossinidius (strain morsitans) TaxID=343509 RepID=Q2NRT8_SODGM|nr:putative phage major tail sheath protein [Sodalis glossinidius str. 'morsitans']